MERWAVALTGAAALRALLHPKKPRDHLRHVPSPLDGKHVRLILEQVQPCGRDEPRRLFEGSDVEEWVARRTDDERRRCDAGEP